MNMKTLGGKRPIFRDYVKFPGSIPSKRSGVFFDVYVFVPVENLFLWYPLHVAYPWKMSYDMFTYYIVCIISDTVNAVSSWWFQPI